MDSSCLPNSCDPQIVICVKQTTVFIFLLFWSVSPHPPHTLLVVSEEMKRGKSKFVAFNKIWFDSSDFVFLKNTVPSTLIKCFKMLLQFVTPAAEGVGEVCLFRIHPASCRSDTMSASSWARGCLCTLFIQINVLNHSHTHTGSCPVQPESSYWAPLLEQKDMYSTYMQTGSNIVIQGNY